MEKKREGAVLTSSPPGLGPASLGEESGEPQYW